MVINCSRRPLTFIEPLEGGQVIYEWRDSVGNLKSFGACAGAAGKTVRNLIRLNAGERWAKDCGGYRIPDTAAKGDVLRVKVKMESEGAFVELAGEAGSETDPVRCPSDAVH